MAILFRTLVYGSLFVAALLVLLPARLLEWSGIGRPSHVGAVQVAGLVVLGIGAVLAAWCVLAFPLVGRGTPAPFDPPRRLVTSGPYRWVRNPMYVGAVLSLTGAALYYGSIVLAAYGVAFLLAAHLFVTAYEERALQRTFGAEYEAYRARVGRWLPRLPRLPRPRRG